MGRRQWHAEYDDAANADDGWRTGLWKSRWKEFWKGRQGLCWTQKRTRFWPWRLALRWLPNSKLFLTASLPRVQCAQTSRPRAHEHETWRLDLPRMWRLSFCFQ